VADVEADPLLVRPIQDEEPVETNLTLALHALIGDGVLGSAADSDDPEEDDRWHRR